MTEIAQVEILKGRTREGAETFGFSWRCGGQTGSADGFRTQGTAAHAAREDVRKYCGGVLVVTNYLQAREAV